MGVKFSNNATTTLAAGISASDLSITLPAGHGARFPALLAGDWFYLTLIDASGNMEIVKVTGRATDVLTVSRAAEGTSARAFSIGTTVSHRLTAQGLQDYGDQLMGAGHMFTVYWWPGSRAGIPAGCAPADGQTLTRALYPDAYAEIAAGKMPVVTEAAWSADPLQRGAYTLGDGSTTFRMPDYNGKQPGSIGAVFFRGDGANSSGVPGVLQGDAIRDITGSFNIYDSSSTSNVAGAFSATGAQAGVCASGGNGYRVGVKFDASRVVPTAAENRPVAATGCWVVKLFGAVSNPGALDAAALNAAKLDKTEFYAKAGTSGALSWRNKIINGSFGINQRAYVSAAATTANQYTLDRWKVSGTGGITFSTAGNKTTVTIPAGQTLTQVVEGLNLQTGTYVLSWEGTAQGKIGAGSYGTSGSVTASITGGTDTSIVFGSGTVANVQLELGTTATPFEQRPYGTELALCQRYYRRLSASRPGATGPVSTFAFGIGYGANVVVTFNFPVPMRTPPTFSWKSLALWLYNGGTTLVTSVGESLSTVDALTIQLSSTSVTWGNTGGASAVGCPTDGTTAFVAFDAEFA